MAQLDGIAGRFLAMHRPGAPLLQPNAFDAGSARILAALGFDAIATTSSGFAATLGRRDGNVTRDEALTHGAALATAVDIPVAADTENGFADDPAGVAETVTLACRTGLAGMSIEDYTGRRDDPIYDAALAVERIRAAAEAAHRGPTHLVLTARAENHLHGRDDLADTIARLQAYQEAGADVLFAPGVTTTAELKTLLASVDRPVNVLPRPGSPSVSELAELGVARVSVGGSFAWAAYAAVVHAANELREQGTYGYVGAAAAARDMITAALAG
jgi:2-methylisocitrate lyase-like PEP mutase family enzyme